MTNSNIAVQKVMISQENNCEMRAKFYINNMRRC